MLDFVLLLSIALGFFLGVCSGLTPGLHTNNFAALLLALSPALLTLGLEPHHLAAVILAASIAHTFLDIIPSVFIGAPDPDTVLAVLPGHAMMLEGRGPEAVRLSALGSASSILVALVLIYPLTLLFRHFSDGFIAHIGLVLLAIGVLMIATEKGLVVEGQGSLVHLKYKALALALFLTSGLLGLFAFEHQNLAVSPFGFEPQVLLPLLSGLFGASLLIISFFSNAEIPPQRDTFFRLPAGTVVKSVFLGGLAGSLVAWIPGVTPAVATVVTRLGSAGSDREFLISVSGVNTANALFALVALLVIGRPRSGAVAAVDKLVTLDQSLLMMMILVVLTTALASYIVTIWAGQTAARIVEKLNYRRLCVGVISFLVAMTLIFTGPFGGFLFFVSTTIGLIAPLAGIRKTHAMGVLMLPLMIRYL